MAQTIEERRAAQRRRVQARRAAGLCSRCGDPSGRFYACLACRTARAAWDAAEAAPSAACVTCGRPCGVDSRRGQCRSCNCRASALARWQRERETDDPLVRWRLDNPDRYRAAIQQLRRAGILGGAR